MRPGRVCRQPVGDVEEFGFGESDEGTPQKGSQGQGVPAIRNRARQRDQVMDLLTAEETLSGLRRNRNAPLLERLLEPPQVGADRRQQSNVAESAGSRAVGASADLMDALSLSQMSSGWRETANRLILSSDVGTLIKLLSRNHARRDDDTLGNGHAVARDRRW